MKHNDVTLTTGARRPMFLTRVVAGGTDEVSSLVYRKCESGRVEDSGSSLNAIFAFGFLIQLIACRCPTQSAPGRDATPRLRRCCCCFFACVNAETFDERAASRHIEAN